MTDLELIVSRLQDHDPEIQGAALKMLHDEVRASQGSIAARTQELLDAQSAIEKCINKMHSEDNRRYLCDILSVMCMLDDGEQCLRYRLQGGVVDLEEWSHQYVRRLMKGILDVKYGDAPAEDYEELIGPIVKFLMKRNGEVETVDFLVEVSNVSPLVGNEMCYFSKAIKSIAEEEEEATEAPGNTEKRVAGAVRLEYFDFLHEAVDDANRMRVLLYVEEMSKFFDLKSVLLKMNEFDPSRYLVCLIRCGMVDQALDYVMGFDEKHSSLAADNPRHPDSGISNTKRQLLHILARNSLYYHGGEEEEAILSNAGAKAMFKAVAESLEVEQPKKLEYMFKGLSRDRIDAAAIANGLVHFAYARDPVFFPLENDFKIKEDHAEQLKANQSISTMASVGLINTFDPASIYDFYTAEIFTQPEIGAVLALAVASCRIRDSNASILNLLAVFLHSSDRKSATAALLGISTLYAATSDSEVFNLVFPLLSSPDNDVALFAIYTLGCVFAGDAKVLTACLDVYENLKKDSAFSNFAILGLALFFYNARICLSDEDFDAPFDENTNDESHAAQFRRLDRHSKVLALGFMHIGTGNAAVVDLIFAKAFVGEIDALLESLGLISCCLIAAGDPLATHICNRIATSSLLLDSPHLRTIVPLCMAILYPSNPDSRVVDILEKSVNSGEANVNSLISLGVVGAGTNSARIFRILDANFPNVYKDSRASAALIYAQGLVNLGKGLFTLSPVCYDGQVLLRKSVVGLISFVFLFIEQDTFKDYPFLSLMVTNAIVPKYVAGYEGTVRVGRPVDVVGMVGHPDRVAAVNVHSLPVVLGVNDRAVAEDKVCTAYIEGVLIKK